MLLLFKALQDIAELTFSVAALYIAVRLYARRQQPAWSQRLDRRRAAFVWLLSLGAVAIKLAEDVLGGESGPIDQAILLFVRERVPPALAQPFELITLTASSDVLTPATVVASAALLVSRRRIEAVLIGASVSTAALAVYLLKAAFGRSRPALWDTQWYWGTSFPSGHTLVVAAFATSAALIAARAWPRVRVPALVAAWAWVTLVGVSRLVLGVHWPTDVLAAACLGAAIPLVYSFALQSPPA